MRSVLWNCKARLAGDMAARWRLAPAMRARRHAEKARHREREGPVCACVPRAERHRAVRSAPRRSAVRVPRFSPAEDWPTRALAPHSGRRQNRPRLPPSFLQGRAEKVVGHVNWGFFFWFFFLFLRAEDDF